MTMPYHPRSEWRVEDKANRDPREVLVLGPPLITEMPRRVDVTVTAELD